MEECYKERYDLALERIGEIAENQECASLYQPYFRKTASFVLRMADAWELCESGRLYELSVEELQEHNRGLYEDILPENYDRSFANPAYAAEIFGERMGRILSFMAAELRGMIPAAFDGSLSDMVIRMELFLEIYGAFVCVRQDMGDGGVPDEEQLIRIGYWYVSDYYEEQADRKIRGLVVPGHDIAERILLKSDLTDLRYLYYYGEYVTENELAAARHLNELPEETVQLMADTYTEGYRIGFEVGNKDISIKETVNVRYGLGFERMIRQAVYNFERIGLKSTFYRAGSDIFQGRSVNKNGYFGANPNKQFDYDHKEDQALFLDGKLIKRKLESMESAYEKYKEQAAHFGGPAVVELFGEQPFTPLSKPQACKYSAKQQKLSVEYTSEAGELQNRYIKGEERSFTIIAFPVPEIGPAYEEIFDEIVRINTLDYKLYQSIQQRIIDVLDQGDYVWIKGMGANRTDLKVKLHTLADPKKETNFENCVADVNIPVGEVFTSPLLSGTEGVLHVTRVFLNELEYKDLSLIFTDGFVTDYSCGNFDSEEENRKYIKENVLFHHEKLPMGEFAIGTNTTAYMTARKYNIEDKMPILIAEKTGPHFAIGDTCYSHAEEVKVYNPDGKEIIARDNEVSALRRKDPEKAYFNCHTDVTVPYDELGELSVVKKDGITIPIILEGRFVLAGCEELNKAFEL